jgi:hypothetical protein
MVERSHSIPAPSSRFTRLEAAVLDALALDPSVVMPDLAQQTRASNAGRRLNTAFGYYVEVRQDKPQHHASGGPTGRFGTVHAMISGLKESVSFKVELYQGRLIGIYADSYGQDTRSIDFTAAQVTELFRLDASGRSVPLNLFSQAPDQKRSSTERHKAAMTPPEVKALVRTALAQRPDTPQAASQRSAPASPAKPASKAREQVARLALEQALTPPVDVEEARKSLLFGIWTAIGAFALFLVLAFDVPLVVAGILAFFTGRMVKDPRVLDAIAASLKKSRELQALKMAAIRANARE